jgi:hypothetical protein
MVLLRTTTPPREPIMLLSSTDGTTRDTGSGPRIADGRPSASSLPFHLVTRHLVPAQFALVVALMVAFDLFEKFLGGGSGLVMAVFGLPIAVLSTLAFVLWAVVHRRRGKLRMLMLGLGTLAAYGVGSSHLRQAGRWIFFETRRTRLEALARDVVAYGRIEQMTDGFRYYKELNHELVAYTPAEIDSANVPGGRARRPLEQVLAKGGIAPQRYDEFRHRLRDVRLIAFDVRPGYVAFEYDGLIDNLEGYLLVRPGGAPPALRSKLFGADLELLEPLGGGWYRFATS